MRLEAEAEVEVAKGGGNYLYDMGVEDDFDDETRFKSWPGSKRMESHVVTPFCYSQIQSSHSAFFSSVHLRQETEWKRFLSNFEVGTCVCVCVCVRKCSIKYRVYSPASPHQPPPAPASSRQLPPAPVPPSTPYFLRILRR